jgi:hypothetical protein
MTSRLHAGPAFCQAATPRAWLSLGPLAHTPASRWTRRGHARRHDAAPADPLAEASPVPAGLVGASVQGRVALGPRGPVRRVGDEPDLGHAISRGPRQARLDGFDLHANVWIPPTIAPASNSSAATSSAPRSPKTASSSGPTGASSSNSRRCGSPRPAYSGGLARGEAVEPVLEDRVDVAVGAGADGLGPGTGGLEPGGAVAAAEAEQPQAGAVALLGMRAVGQDGGDAPDGLGAESPALRDGGGEPTSGDGREGDRAPQRFRGDSSRGVLSRPAR